MAKELPYFKFFPSEWITGDITLCTMEAQGVFVNILGFYWNKNCNMNLANAKQRFSKNVTGFNQLLEMGIIKVDKDENIIINFLDEQMNEFINVAEKRAVAGKKGGLANAKQMLKFAKAKRSYRDKEIEKEEDKDKIKIDGKTSLLYQDMMKIYYDWFENTYNMKPKIDGGDGKGLNDIIKYFRTNCKDDTIIISSWKLIFDNWSRLGDFYANQNRLRQINSNIQNIIIQLKKNIKNNSQTKDYYERYPELFDENGSFKYGF